MIEPIVGQTYIIKLTSGKRARARFLHEHRIVPYRNINSLLFNQPKSRTHYHFLNLATNREVILKSRVKITASIEPNV